MGSGLGNTAMAQDTAGFYKSQTWPAAAQRRLSSGFLSQRCPDLKQEFPWGHLTSSLQLALPPIL